MLFFSIRIGLSSGFENVTILEAIPGLGLDRRLQALSSPFGYFQIPFWGGSGGLPLGVIDRETEVPIAS